MEDYRPKRPNALTRFDHFYFVTLAVNLATALAVLPRIEEEIARRPELAASGISVMSVFPALVGSFLLLLVPWFFISRLRSNVARWLLTIFVGLFAINSVMLLPTLATKGIDLLVTLANVALSIGTVSCLFVPEARSWFRRAG